MFDLRTMNTVIPLDDIFSSVGIMVVAIMVANLALFPALVTRDARAGGLFGGVSGVGMACILAVLALQPSGFFPVVFGYILAFLSAGSLLGWRVLGWRQTVIRVVTGVGFISLTLLISRWIIYMPR